MYKLKRFIKDILLEPLILGFALFIVFDRVRDAYNKADYPTFLSRMGGVMLDLGTYPYIYIPFVLLVILWAYWKYKSVVQGTKEANDLMTVVNDNNQKLQLLIERIDKLISILENENHRTRQERNERKDKSKP